MEPITKADWVQWKNDRVTRFYLSSLMTKREHLKEGIVEDHAGESERVLYLSIGQAMALKDAIQYALEHFEYTEEPDDNQGSSVSSPSAAKKR